MSSPARSSASATSGGGQGGGVSGNAGFGDDTISYHLPTDLMSAHDRKEEALAALKAELMAGLQKEVKSLDEDSWKFARPRSQIHLVSRPGRYQHKFMGIEGNVNHLFKQTRDI